MGSSDLQWVVKVPVPSCPKCGKEGNETVAGLINRDKIPCGFCSALIDLTSEDWRVYLQETVDALDKLGPSYRKIP